MYELTQEMLDRWFPNDPKEQARFVDYYRGHLEWMDAMAEVAPEKVEEFLRTPEEAKDDWLDWPGRVFYKNNPLWELYQRKCLEQGIDCD